MNESAETLVALRSPGLLRMNASAPALVLSWHGAVEASKPSRRAEMTGIPTPELSSPKGALTARLSVPRTMYHSLIRCSISTYTLAQTTSRARETATSQPT